MILISKIIDVTFYNKETKQPVYYIDGADATLDMTCEIEDDMALSIIQEMQKRKAKNNEL